ncbi:hypothetical protein RSAG8_00805, partial [Rhizoctonia solani AG-8 WAC10335]
MYGFKVVDPGIRLFRYGVGQGILHMPVDNSLSPASETTPK